MNALEKKRKEVQEKLEDFGELQKLRKMDFPMNTIHVCENNLYFLTSYFNREMMQPSYSIKLDTILQTHVINYLNGVKGYINRKNKMIQGSATRYKTDLLNIVRKYWHTGHKVISDLDRVIHIRDYFEHEEIGNFTLKTTFKDSGPIKRLFYKEIDLLELFANGLLDLKRMNVEIEDFISAKMEACNLWDCTMFENAFKRKFGSGEETVLNPEPTESQLRDYDQLIISLSRNND